MRMTKASALPSTLTGQPARISSDRGRRSAQARRGLLPLAEPAPSGRLLALRALDRNRAALQRAPSPTSSAARRKASISARRIISASPQHPAIRAAAHEAIERYGVHSAGSPAFIGNTTHSIALERKISEFLGMERTVLFPTGFAAGFGAIKGLVRSSDHIVMDSLAHACLQEGAAAATKNVFLFRHLDVESARRWLSKIRAKDTTNGDSRRHRRPVLDGFRHARHRRARRSSATNTTRR